MNEQLEAILWELLRESDAPFTTLEFIVEEAKEKIQAMAPSVPQVCPQPIESAPNSGTILGFRLNRWEMFTWDDDNYATKSRPFWKSSGSFGKTMDRANQPTHWLPLPPPPGEVALQVCPNCEEMRRWDQVLAFANEGLGSEGDNGEVIALEQIQALALSTLKSKEPQK